MLTKEIPGREQLASSPIETMESAQRASPIEFPFGAFSGDLGGGAGAGVMFFHWHASPSELLSAIAEIEPLLRDFSKAEADSFQQRFGQARNKGGKLTAELLDEVNTILKESDSTIGWWGSFADLKNSQEGFCNDFRLQFRLDLGSRLKSGHSPIDNSEEPAFIEFIREFGF